MGVLACNRNGCDHVMCDRYSHTYGYICNDCFDELLAKYNEMTIEEFMESEKVYVFSCDPYITLNEEFPVNVPEQL